MGATLGPKVKSPSFWTIDVLVARVPFFGAPTEIIAVAAVLMKTSEYQTKPPTFATT